MPFNAQLKGAAQRNGLRMSDQLRIFTVLNKHGVDYMVIGGVAVIAWGHTRNTRDVDILASPDAANMAYLAAALVELHARLSGIDAELPDVALDADTLGNGANFTMETSAGGLDYFSEVPGADMYDNIRSRSDVVTIADTPIRIVSREDLIRMKLAAGRDHDLRDVAVVNMQLDNDSDHGD
jgi:hypothetical protein